MESLKRLIDELVHFKFKEFDHDFLENLKKELPKLLSMVNNVLYSFQGEDAVKESKLYEERLKEKARRARQRATLTNIDKYLQDKEAGLVADFDIEAAFGSVEGMIRSAGEDDSDIGSDGSSGNDWKYDIGERSRRVYEWWRTMMNERKYTLPYFFTAIRFLATVQVSSAATE